MKTLLRYFVILVVTALGFAHAQTSPIVIGDGFGSGWGSWSWPASPQPVSVVTSPVFKGSSSVRMNFNAQWAGFSPGANSGPFDTTGYTSLVFAVYNASNAGQLYLRATKPDGTQTDPSIYLQDYTTQNVIAPNQWTWIRIPIADLQLGANPQIAYFAIQSANIGTAYFDEMRFEANTTLYEGVQQQGGPTVQRFNWGSVITQMPLVANQPDYWLEANITSPWGSVQFHEVMKYSGTLPSSNYGLLTALFQKTTSAQSIIANLVGEGNVVYGSLNLENYVAGGTATVGVWYRVLIPISDFGITYLNLDGVIFSGNVAGTFKLDDVRFVENLRFPLAGYTGNSAKITAPMDHSMGADAFCSNGTVIAFSGELGSSVYGVSSWYFPSPNGSCAGVFLRGYKNGSNIDFTLGGQYMGTSDGPKYLFYEGHPGIDYYAPSPTPVVATASGKIIVNECASSPCSGFGVVKIDHGYGLVTSYNHLSAIAPGLGVGSYVHKGQSLGTSGYTGLSSSAAHLHISTVWGMGNPQYIDPHGWKGSYPDPYVGVGGAPYTNAKNVCLWEGGC